MALLSVTPDTSHPKKHRKRSNTNTNTSTVTKSTSKKDQKQPSSWYQFKNLLTCKQIEPSKIHDPSSSKPLSSCKDICSFRDVVHGNTRVVHRADHSPDDKCLITRKGTNSSRSIASSGRSNGGNGSYSRGGMQLRKLSGCYECHTIGILDPSRYPSPRTTICACSECGEVFPTLESMELHRAIRHAVYELAPDDSGRNIVEIIFKSSWLKKDNPIVKIERILKVHNTPRTVQRFEDCRDSVKLRARKNPRCAADGNELLRFHCATLACSLGARGSSSLCQSVPTCGVCTIIRNGFKGTRSEGKGVRTTASSGRAHDCLSGFDGRRAMLVCRVIAGRVRRTEDGILSEEEHVASGSSYESEAGYAGVYSNLEELYVFNPRAILPCFVVIYKSLES